MKTGSYMAGHVHMLRMSSLISSLMSSQSKIVRFNPSPPAKFIGDIAFIADFSCQHHLGHLALMWLTRPTKFVMEIMFLCRWLLAGLSSLYVYYEANGSLAMIAFLP